VPTAQPDYPHIVEIPSPIWVINQRNSRHVNQHLKEFLANLRMALAWFFRSFALERLRQEPVVVLMIPLLFEAGLEALCSEVWLVDCDEDQQLRRLMDRDGLSAADARARLAAQWPLARKRTLAAVVLDNRGGPQALAPRVERALRAGAVPAAPSPPPV